MQKLLQKYKLNLAFVVLTTLVFASCKTKQPVTVIMSDEPQTVAVTNISRFSQSEQMTIDYAFLEGVKRVMIEDYGTALGLFLDVLRMDNQHAPANFQISKIRLMQNQLNEAEIYAERAWRLSSQNKFYLEHLAYIYRHNNKFPQALNSLEHLRKLDPQNDEDYLLEMADIHLLQRKPTDALRMYDSIEKRHGVSDEISMQKIRIYQALGREANIRSELQKLFQKFPNETKYWSILAELNMHAKKYSEAFENYQKILSLDPENAYVHLSLADYYKVMNDSVKMFEQLILAFENPKLDVDAKVTLTVPYYNIPSQKENTYKMLDAVLSAHPEDPKALALYADFLQRDDHYLEARNKYRKVIALDASKYPVWEALLYCNFLLLDSTGLLHDSQEALERFPEQPWVYYMLGTAYHIKKDYEMAMQYLEQAVQLAQSNRSFLLQIYTDLGGIYHYLENHAKSDANYRKALEIDPNSVIVLNNFAYFLSLRKENLDEAERMTRSVCQREPTNPTYLDTFAWVLYQQGKYTEAKAIMELALENGGDKEAVLLEHYGDILWKTGEKKRALEYWRQAQTIDAEACSEFLNDKIKTETLIEN
jgi:tetratricopeptide (TPR) repeat protein